MWKVLEGKVYEEQLRSHGVHGLSARVQGVFWTSLSNIGIGFCMVLCGARSWT